VTRYYGLPLQITRAQCGRVRVNWDGKSGESMLFWDLRRGDHLRGGLSLLHTIPTNRGYGMVIFEGSVW
jgi:hypothetical protein